MNRDRERGGQIRSRQKCSKGFLEFCLPCEKSTQIEITGDLCVDWGKSTLSAFSYLRFFRRLSHFPDWALDEKGKGKVLRNTRERFRGKFLGHTSISFLFKIEK